MQSLILRVYFSLFVVVCVYLIGGVLYNAFVKHQTGINLLPQAQFWIKLPLHAIVN